MKMFHLVLVWEKLTIIKRCFGETLNKILTEDRVVKVQPLDAMEVEEG